MLSSKDLPSFAYPPQDASWATFEMEARGTIPRSDGIALYESPADSRKRKAAENAAAEAARQRDFALSKRPHTGGMRYKDMPGYSNELQRMLDQAVRPSHYPEAIALWEQGKAIGMNLIHKLQDGGPLATFYPPLSLFFGVQKREKLVSMVIRLLELWPMMHQRIVLARTDPAVTRLGNEDWRRILTGVHFKFDVGRPENEPLDFANCEAMYRYGSAMVFGQAATTRIQAGNSDALEIGMMGCGHRATAVDVDDDKIIQAILTRLTEELMPYEFAAMAPTAWKDLPAVTDKYGTYRMPAFRHSEDTQVRSAAAAIALIKDIVGFDREPSVSRGWHQELRGLRRSWLLHMRTFFTKYTDGMEHFADQPEGEGPWNKPFRHLVHVPWERLHKSDYKQLEKLLLEAWWVCLFKIGRTPQPLLPPVLLKNHMPDCKACRTPLEPNNPYDWDFSDEDE